MYGVERNDNICGYFFLVVMRQKKFSCASFFVFLNLDADVDEDGGNIFCYGNNFKNLEFFKKFFDFF